ncbi:MAG: GTPase SAR1 family protein, partial [Kiritimatiellia bacterium]
MTADSALHLFALRRTRAADTLDGLADAVDDLGGEVSRAADRLRTTAARAREGRFVVLLVGCFSSGKSTLLNALLGQPVLPVKVNPCTAILTELVYSDVPSVEVRFRDGRPPEVLTPEAFLQRYQLRTLTDEDAGAEVRDRFGAVDRAVVSWPLPLLRNGVVLIDTPGLDDDDVRTARTLASLPDADAVIFVLAATRFLTDLERRTLRRELLPLGLTNLFFPVTMVDLVDALSDNPERDLLALNQQAQEALGPLCQVNDKDRFDQRFFPLNARGGLHARWDRAAQQRRTEPHVAELESTGLAAFEDHLERFLVSERGNAQLMHLVGQATLAHDVVARQAAMDEATASASVEDLRERAEKLQPRFSELETIADRVADSVDHFIVRQQNAVWHSLRGFLAETEDQLEDAINGFDLGTVPGFDLLTTRGRKRVEQALQEQLESWLDERVQEWQNSLRPHLEGALHGLRQELAADAQDFDALAREIVTDFAGGTLELPYSSG